MRALRAGSFVGLAAILLILAALPAQAAEPRSTEWGSATVEGAPTGVGFLAGGFIAYATANAGGTGLDSGGACSIDGGDADLYLFSFPGGPGCLQAIDSSGSEVGREGVTALATAARAGLVVTALAPSDVPQATPDDIVVWGLDEGNLTERWSRAAEGPALLVDTDPNGQRIVAAIQDGDRPATATYRLNVYGADGARTTSFELRGQPQDLAISSNTRYVAVAGNYTQGNTSFGWAHLYDTSRSASENPVVTREFQRARGGNVASVAVTDGGSMLTGHLDGAVTWLSPEHNAEVHQVDNETAYVATSRDGRQLAAAAGDRVVGLTAPPDSLDEAWSRTVNGTVTDLLLRQGTIFAVAGDAHGYTTDGVPLWTTAGGATVATNSTGLALAAGQRGSTTATGVGSSTLTAREVHRNATIRQVDAAPTISPRSIGIVNVTIENNGSAVLNGSLRADAPGNLGVSFTPDRLRLLPGENATVQAAVRVGARANPGPVSIPTELASKPRVDASTNLSVEVGSLANVSVRFEPGAITDRGVVQGQNLSIRLLVSNQGNTDTEARLGLTQVPSRGDPWPAQLDPSGEITVPEGTTTTVRLDVTVPEAAANGTMNRIVVRAATDRGSAATSLALTVNPFQVLELTPQTLTKKMAPGAIATYSFQLSNLGSIPANVTVSAQAIGEDGQPYVPSEWGIALTRSNAELEPGASTDVRLEISGPTNATDRESLRVQILTVSQQGAKASSLAFGVVDSSLAGPDDEEPKREPLPVLVPVLALLLGGSLIRRCPDDKL